MTAAPGTIGLVHMGGPARGPVRIMQYLDGDGWEDYEHAFVMLPGGKILEAGSPVSRVRAYPYLPSEVYWCTAIYSACLPGAVKTRPWLLEHVAKGLTGVPYSYADYGAIGAHRLHLDFIPGLRDYVADSGHMICSQLADEFYLRAGQLFVPPAEGHVFTDNRWPGFVTPGMLYRREQELRKILGKAA